MRGTMLWFNEEKDFGFVATEEGERLLVRGDGFKDGERPEGRCRGLVVEFELSGTDDGREAAECSFVVDAAAHRPRIRNSTRVRT
jgi:cold shock CspA family protein